MHMMAHISSLLQDICSHSQPHLSSSSSIDHDDYLHDHTHFGHLSMISQHIRLFYAYNDSYLFIIARYTFTLTTMEIFFFFFYCSWWIIAWSHTCWAFEIDISAYVAYIGFQILASMIVSLIKTILQSSSSILNKQFHSLNTTNPHMNTIAKTETKVVWTCNSSIDGLHYLTWNTIRYLLKKNKAR